jgi:hypothetical protein
MLDIKGSFRVNKVRTIQSNIQYAVLFLEDRMIFAKIGGQFADGGLAGAISGGVVGGALGGIIGATIEQKLQKSSAKKKDEKIRNLSEMSIDEVLQLDKNNFELYYGDIIKIEMKNSTFSFNGARSGTISIERKKKEKFDLAANQNYEDCEKLVSALLPGKLPHK